MVPAVGRRVVVLSNDGAAGQQIADYLAANGLVSEACASTHALLEHLGETSPSLVLLDWEGGRSSDAVEIVRHIHDLSPVACILRADPHATESERVQGLENGVDDWIPAGTRMREVLARVRAVLRRAPALASAVPAGPASTRPLPATTEPESRAHPSPLRTWRLSPARRELFAPGGQPCGLTAAEFDLIYTLAQHKRSAVSREALSQAVFRRAWNPDDRSIDNLVVRLKRKLARHAESQDMIKAVRGVGYVFTGF